MSNHALTTTSPPQPSLTLHAGPSHAATGRGRDDRVTQDVSVQLTTKPERENTS